MKTMIDNERKMKAVLAISLFTIAMVIVGTVCFKVGTQAGYDKGYEEGYNDGYADAEQYWMDLINTNLGPVIDAVYLEGYALGFQDGYLWGFVDAWNEYGNGSLFRYPNGGVVP